MPDYIYSMYKVGRHYPPDRDVLRDISLSFFYGAKIGVIGPNGAGKSSLLSESWPVATTGLRAKLGSKRDTRSGCSSRSPSSTESKDVLGNVLDGVAPTKALLDEYQEVLAGWADPDADYEKLGARQESLEKKIEAAGAWELDRQVEIAMDALRLPPGDADVSKAVRWRTSTSGAVSFAPALAPRSLAARRTDQPSRRRISRVARAISRTSTRGR